MVHNQPKGWYYSMPKGSLDPLMKKHWTKWTPVNGLVSESISPFRQDPMKGFFKDVFGNSRRFITHKTITMAPAVVVGLAIYTWGNAEYDRLQRAHWT